MRLTLLLTSFPIFSPADWFDTLKTNLLSPSRCLGLTGTGRSPSKKSTSTPTLTESTRTTWPCWGCSLAARRGRRRRYACQTPRTRPAKTLKGSAASPQDGVAPLRIRRRTRLMTSTRTAPWKRSPLADFFFGFRVVFSHLRFQLPPFLGNVNEDHRYYVGHNISFLAHYIHNITYLKIT